MQVVFLSCRLFPIQGAKLSAKQQTTKQGETMQAKTKEQYRKAWNNTVNELSILSFSFDTTDKEFSRIIDIQKELKEIVKAAANKLDIPEK